MKEKIFFFRLFFFGGQKCFWTQIFSPNARFQTQGFEIVDLSALEY